MMWLMRVSDDNCRETKIFKIFKIFKIPKICVLQSVEWQWSMLVCEWRIRCMLPLYATNVIPIQFSEIFSFLGTQILNISIFSSFLAIMTHVWKNCCSSQMLTFPRISIFIMISEQVSYRIKRINYARIDAASTNYPLFKKNMLLYVQPFLSAGAPKLVSAAVLKTQR